MKQCVRSVFQFTTHNWPADNKIPAKWQLTDIATIAQPEELFLSQRESLMRWESKGKTKAQLLQPEEHLRACDIAREFLRVSLLPRLQGLPPDPFKFKQWMGL